MPNRKDAELDRAARLKLRRQRRRQVRDLKAIITAIPDPLPPAHRVVPDGWLLISAEN